MRCVVPNGGSGVVGLVGGFVSAVTNEVAEEDEDEDEEEDGGESLIASTSIGVRIESPKVDLVVRDGVDGRR